MILIKFHFSLGLIAVKTLTSEGVTFRYFYPAVPKQIHAPGLPLLTPAVRHIPVLSVNPWMLFLSNLWGVAPRVKYLAPIVSTDIFFHPGWSFS